MAITLIWWQSVFSVSFAFVFGWALVAIPLQIAKGNDSKLIAVFAKLSAFVWIMFIGVALVSGGVCAILYSYIQTLAKIAALGG